MINLLKGTIVIGVGLVFGVAMVKAIRKAKEDNDNEQNDVTIEECLDEETLKQINQIKKECRKTIIRNTILKLFLTIGIPMMITRAMKMQQNERSVVTHDNSTNEE